MCMLFFRELILVIHFHLVVISMFLCFHNFDSAQEQFCKFNWFFGWRQCLRYDPNNSSYFHFIFFFASFLFFIIFFCIFVVALVGWLHFLCISFYKWTINVVNLFLGFVLHFVYACWITIFLCFWCSCFPLFGFTWNIFVKCRVCDVFRLCFMIKNHTHPIRKPKTVKETIQIHILQKQIVENF